MTADDGRPRSAIALVTDAAAFALTAHGDQMRAEAGDAYGVHLAEVARHCAVAAPDDAELIAAAWLHDAVEQAGVPLETVRLRFGERVASLVDDCTDPPGLRGKARRQRQVDHTAAASASVKQIKLADKTSNVEELLHAPEDRLRSKSARRYLAWARRVVAVCAGVDPALEARFHDAAERLASRLGS